MTSDMLKREYALQLQALGLALDEMAERIKKTQAELSFCQVSDHNCFNISASASVIATLTGRIEMVEKLLRSVKP